MRLLNFVASLGLVRATFAENNALEVKLTKDQKDLDDRLKTNEKSFKSYFSKFESIFVRHQDIEQNMKAYYMANNALDQFTYSVQVTEPEQLAAAIKYVNSLNYLVNTLETESVRSLKFAEYAMAKKVELVEAAAKVLASLDKLQDTNSLIEETKATMKRSDGGKYDELIKRDCAKCQRLV
jgi:hypothetical protein